MAKEHTEQYAPQLAPEAWTDRDIYYLTPFVTDPSGNIAVLRNLPPEVAGALCSRASRAKGSLPRVLLEDFWYPILDGENKILAQELDTVVKFLHEHDFRNVLNAKRAEGFFAKVLAAYGDDSVAQTTGTHVSIRGISQVAMKHIEDQRLGIEPIEKSTRYVDFGIRQPNGSYLYYTPVPDLVRLGLLDTYRITLDNLFGTYNTIIARLKIWLAQKYPEATAHEIEKKAFDTSRGLLPMATLGQVGFRGNGQAFEYLLNRSLKHQLGEIQWMGSGMQRELAKEIPSLIVRTTDDKSHVYQEYLSCSVSKLEHELTSEEYALIGSKPGGTKTGIALLWYDPHGEDKIIAGLLANMPHATASFDLLLEYVGKSMTAERKAELLERFFSQRHARWYKLPRAFELAHFLFEIVMDIGAYRDLHRHRPLTQERQLFTTAHGYAVPTEITEAGLESMYRSALDMVAPLYKSLARESMELAQYVVPLAYRVRFYQEQSLTSAFWTAELRTTSQGHPDYRRIEQEKCRLISNVFPHLAKYMLVDFDDYTFARRGEEKKIAEKEERLTKRQ